MPLWLVFPAFMAFILLLSVPFFGRRERRFVLIALPLLGLVTLLALGFVQASAGIDQAYPALSLASRLFLMVLMALAALAALPEALVEGLVQVGGPQAPAAAALALGVVATMAVALVLLHRRASRRQSDR